MWFLTELVPMLTSCTRAFPQYLVLVHRLRVCRLVTLRVFSRLLHTVVAVFRPLRLRRLTALRRLWLSGCAALTFPIEREWE
jgi:hypothetical protein